MSRTVAIKVKRAVVGIIGRERANRISAPYHDWAARARTSRVLASLPSEGLCVNFGCGPRILNGWINLDINRADGIDVVWNLKFGMPFPDNSCTALFGEHVIEHISKEDGEKLLRECHRALEPGGVLRLSTPDAGLYLRSYAGDREFLRHPSFDRPAETAMDRINTMMREDGGHLWVYDAESLMKLVESAGFKSVAQKAFNESAHPKMQGIDSEGRAFESLYVEGKKLEN
jgi:predicted SAM-dependent methyltransferase